MRFRVKNWSIGSSPFVFSVINLRRKTHRFACGMEAASYGGLSECIRAGLKPLWGENPVSVQVAHPLLTRNGGIRIRVSLRSSWGESLVQVQVLFPGLK